MLETQMPKTLVVEEEGPLGLSQVKVGVIEEANVGAWRRWSTGAGRSGRHMRVGDLESRHLCSEDDRDIASGVHISLQSAARGKGNPNV
jgi:hypothetical protein